MGISHMRLCPTNILIDNEATFKIGDFLGKFGILSIHDPAVITPEYSATVLCWQPSEIISEITKSAVRASPKADVFSLACCIFYALTGQHPYGTFASGDRLAAGGYTPSGPLFVNGGVSEVIENIHSDYISNQHLLYNCPLVLDLCMRCLSHDPGDRLDVTELSRHPLFWDFDVTKNFILALPIGNEIFREFCDYELLWKDIVAADSVVNGGGPIASKYSNTINGILEFLINSWNSALSANVRNFAPPPSVMAPISAVWLKVFDRFPHVLIRAWDGARIAAVIKSDEQVTTGPPRAEAFKRHHLHWMMLRSSAVTSISHSFVREYYHLVNGILGGPQVGKWPTCLIFPDESTGLSDACNSYSASIVASIRSCKKSLPPPPSVGVKYVPSPSIPPQVWPSGSPCVLPQTCLPAAACGTPGMKFLDPMIVKQMAAASAALTAVYENPELVVAISQKSGDNGQINPHSQLVAAATIYASLLADSSSTAGAVTSSSIW
jgi:hypothetical protein